MAESMNLPIRDADPERWRILGLLGIAQLMLILDVTVVAIALPHMGADLGLDRETLTWVVSGYTLAFGGFLLLGGRAADLFGARRLVLTGPASVRWRVAARRACHLGPNAPRWTHHAGARGGNPVSRRALARGHDLRRRGAEQGEARREFDLGKLRERRRFALPLLAALGGMAVPVTIYLLFNLGSSSAWGWGIAMSTDTAFAVAAGLAVELRLFAPAPRAGPAGGRPGGRVGDRLPDGALALARQRVPVLAPARLLPATSRAQGPRVRSTRAYRPSLCR